MHLEGEAEPAEKNSFMSRLYGSLANVSLNNQR